MQWPERDPAVPGAGKQVDRIRSADRSEVGSIRPSAEAPQGGDRLQMLGMRPNLAFFPVVDRLGGRAKKESAFARRDAQAATLRRQALGAEAERLGRSLLLSSYSSGSGPPGHDTQLLLQGLRAALERGDLRSVSGSCLLESDGLGANFLSRDAADFCL